MSRHPLYVLTVLSLSMFLRVYPTFLSGMPFSTDSWPLIKNTEKIILYTPVRLGGDGLFDDYNIYWPLSQIFSGIVSLVLGVTVMDGMRYLIPATSAFTPLLYYILLRRAAGNDELAFIASLLMASNGVHAVFTAGVTKETYANPLLIQSIYYFVNAGSSTHEIILFILVTAALVATHHLTFFILIAILLNILLAGFLIRKAGSGLSRQVIMVLSALTLLLGYYLLYASPGLKMTLSFEDILSVASFQAVTFTMTMYIFLMPAPRRIPAVWFSSIAVIVAILVANQFINIVPGAPPLTTAFLPFIAGNIFIVILAIVGGYTMKGLGAEKNMLPAGFWLSAVVGLELYALFGSKPELSLTLVYRLYNFLFPALAAFSALGFIRLFSTRVSGISQKIVGLSLIVICIFLLATLSYNATLGQENYSGYQWFYSLKEFREALWLSKSFDGNFVYGDAKIRYLLSDYMGVNVDIGGGYRYLSEIEKKQSSAVIVTYNSMYKNGFVVGPYGMQLPEKWHEQLEKKQNIIYKNNGNSIYIS